MKTSILLSTLPTVALAAVGDRILWADEFNSGSLNTASWNYDIGTGEWGWGNGELQSYTDNEANVKVQDGTLQITALRNSDGSGFTSGRVNTAGKMEFQYGRVEAIIKVPDVADGLWPAFWTLGNNYYEVGWPNAGEIDIMEIGQGLAITEQRVNRRVIGGAHWEAENELAAYALWLDYPEDLFLQYRKYTLDWTPTRMATFVDDVKVWEMDISSGACRDCEEFHRPHFLIMNLAVGGLFTSTGGNGSSAASASSSSAGGCIGSSSAAAASSSSSSGGCAQARTDVTAPLPATMSVDSVRIIDNGFTVITTIDDNVFEATPTNSPFSPPVPAPIPAPIPAPTPAPQATPTLVPVPPPTPSPFATPPPQTSAPVISPTLAPQAGPTPSPIVVSSPTSAPMMATTPAPQEQEFVSPSAPSPSAPTESDRVEPDASPVQAPVATVTEDSTGGSEEESDCLEAANSGKSGKGKSGKGSRRRLHRRGRRLDCDEGSGKGKSGKGKSSKSSKKGGASSDETTVAFASLTSAASMRHPSQISLPALVLPVVLAFLSTTAL